jgi:hypothetical protein
MKISEGTFRVLFLICSNTFAFGLCLIAIGGNDLSFPYKCPPDTFHIDHSCRYVNISTDSVDYIYDNDRYISGLAETISGSILMLISIIICISCCRCIKVQPKSMNIN